MEGLGDEEQKKAANDNKEEEEEEEEWVKSMSDAFFSMLKRDAIGYQYTNGETFTEEEMRTEATTMANAWRKLMLKNGITTPEVPLVYKVAQEDGRLMYAELGTQKVCAVEFKPFTLNDTIKEQEEEEELKPRVCWDKEKRPKLTPAEINSFGFYSVPHFAGKDEEDDLK